MLKRRDLHPQIDAKFLHETHTVQAGIPERNTQIYYSIKLNNNHDSLPLAGPP